MKWLVNSALTEYFFCFINLVIVLKEKQLNIAILRDTGRENIALGVHVLGVLDEVFTGMLRLGLLSTPHPFILLPVSEKVPRPYTIK